MSSAYSESQLDAYQSYVNLPHEFRREAKPALDLNLLHALHIHQLSAIPYENLSLHYSKDHKICLEPQHLFRKLQQNGRGGYCMENSIFFNHILRAVGFRAYTAGVRIRYRVNGVPEGDYRGWSHIVNVVTLSSGEKFMVDISFGGDGATKPIPLIHGHVVQKLGTQEVRLMYDNLPDQVELSHKLWIYQYRNGPDRPWNSFYAFPEFEFLHQGFDIMNYATSTNNGSFQTFTVQVVKFLRDGERGIFGKVMLVNGEVKLNTGSKTSVVQVCKTEAARVQALKHHFRVELTEEERLGIKGTRTELIESQC